MTASQNTAKRGLKINHFFLAIIPKLVYIILMTKSEIEANISHLHAHLAEDPDLSEADKVALRNGIGDLEDKLALLDFQESEDIDYGYHDQYDF
jgi:hypothetical protein